VGNMEITSREGKSLVNRTLVVTLPNPEGMLQNNLQEVASSLTIIHAKEKSFEEVPSFLCQFSNSATTNAPKVLGKTWLSFPSLVVWMIKPVRET
jgi:hypothetical protein